jgi:hypothetical protein
MPAGRPGTTRAVGRFYAGVASAAVAGLDRLRRVAELCECTAYSRRHREEISELNP